MKYKDVSLCILLAIITLHCGSTVNYDLPVRKYKNVVTGLERFIDHYAEKYAGEKAVLVTNHSGVDSKLRKNLDLLRNRRIEIIMVLAPEHGLYGYENSYDGKLYRVDNRLNVIIYNLHKLNYSSLKHLIGIAEIVIFDIQDMGMRCYTYISALKEVMDALNGTKIELIILDRPNPLDYLGVDGPFLDPRFFSRHVSAFPVPFLYDMTIGEAARYYKGEYARRVKLKVIPLYNYSRNIRYNETMLPWIPPSPNLPTYESSLIYSMMVMLEGVNISVGRGTTKPFEYVGAPWINPDELCNGLKKLGLKNFRFLPVYFSPTFSKYRGRRCGGVQIFYIGGRFKPFEVAYAILQYLRHNYIAFRWEGRYGQYWVDYLAGTDLFRKSIDEKLPYRLFEKKIKKGLKRFKRKRSKYLMY